jgi:hypothetical protein
MAEKQITSLTVLQDHKRYFLQLCTDPLNQSLLTKCIAYFDKLLDFWTDLGVVLVT